jgi:hypothetical protein
MNALQTSRTCMTPYDVPFFNVLSLDELVEL